MEPTSPQSGSCTGSSNHLPTTTTAPGDQQPSTAELFDEIRAEIGKIDPDEETIELTYQLRKFAELFHRRITNHQLLNDLFPYLNEEALSNASFAIKLATVFASRQLADVSLCETRVRSTVIRTLQDNFIAVKRLKQENINRFYNSVTLLGEYYNRKRVGFGKPICILGHSLLLLLTSELEQEISKSCQQPAKYRFKSSMAKLVLAQVILNGTELTEDHKSEIQDLLYTVRKALVVIPHLSAHARAFLLMTLDMYYGHMAGNHKLYSKYLNESETVAEEQHSRSVEKDNKHSPSVTGGKTKKNQTTQTPENDAATGQKSHEGAKASTSARSSGKSGKASNQNNTTNDKENKRRSQTKAVPVQKTSPKSASGTENRSIRLHEDGNIVATITRRNTPNGATAAPATSPTKKHPHNKPQHPSGNGSSPRSSTSKQKDSPRMEKLTTMPKITITGATPSPKRTQDRQNPSATTSSRAVLGPSIAKQKSHPPPKSPTTRHDTRERQHGSTNVPRTPPARNRHDRTNGRGPEPRATKAEQQHSSNGSNAFKLTNVDGRSSTHSPHVAPEPQNWEPLDWNEPELDTELDVHTSAPWNQDTVPPYATTNRRSSSPYLYDPNDPLEGRILLEGTCVIPCKPYTSFKSFLARE